MLYTVKELNKENLSSLIFDKPIQSIGSTFIVKSIQFNLNGEVSNEIRKQQKKGVAFFEGKVVSLKDTISKVLESEGKNFDKYLIDNFDKLILSVGNKHELLFNHKINIPGLYFKNNDTKCNINFIDVGVKCVIEKKLFNKQKLYSYKKEGEDKNIEIVRHESSESSDYFDIITSEEDGLLKFVSSDKDGNHVAEIEYMYSFDENNQLIKKKLKNDH